MPQPLEGVRVLDLTEDLGLSDLREIPDYATRGDLPTHVQAQLLEAALFAAVDHGPQAPSIAAARIR